MSTQGNYLKAIADAIRTQEGSTAAIPAKNFASRVRGLPVGIQLSSTTVAAQTTQAGYLQTIADAISAKEGSTGNIQAKNFADRILALSFVEPEFSDEKSVAMASSVVLKMNPDALVSPSGVWDNNSIFICGTKKSIDTDNKTYIIEGTTTFTGTNRVNAKTYPFLALNPAILSENKEYLSKNNGYLTLSTGETPLARYFALNKFAFSTGNYYWDISRFTQSGMITFEIRVYSSATYGDAPYNIWYRTTV